MNTQLRQQWMEKIDVLCQVKNWEYARFLCLEILCNEPNFIDARRILHRIRQYTFCKRKIRRWLLLLSIFPSVLWYMFRIKTKHQQLLSAMDKLLDVDPNNILTLRLFAEAMLGRSFWETAIFFIECIPEDERNGDDWLLIGESFLGLEKFQLAIDIASKILINFPNNMRARDLLWQSSVKHSMNGEYFGVK